MVTLSRKSTRHDDNVTRAFHAGTKAMGLPHTRAEVARILSSEKETPMPPLACDQCGKRIWTVFPGHLCRECAKDAA